MPDIIITCPECAREHKISEYAVTSSLACLTCGAELRKPSQESNTGLRLVTATGPTVAPPVGRTGLPTLPPEVAGPPSQPSLPPVASIASVKPPPAAREAPRGLSFGLMMLLVLGMVGFQTQADAWSAYLPYYEWTRLGLLAVAYLLVTMMAFQDGLAPAMLCVAVPPYALLYAMSSIESWLLRGVLYGCVLGVLAETYFLPDHSLVFALGEFFGDIVTWGDTMIGAASGSPLRR